MKDVNKVMEMLCDMWINKFHMFTSKTFFFTWNNKVGQKGFIIKNLILQWECMEVIRVGTNLYQYGFSLSSSNPNQGPPPPCMGIDDSKITSRGDPSVSMSTQSIPQHVGWSKVLLEKFNNLHVIPNLYVIFWS